MTTNATGIGSMPGEDIAEAVRVVAGELDGFVHLPELPARGAHATMTGRGVALLEGLAADLQPAGWRLTGAVGRDQRRSRSLLGQDLDVLEEHLQEYAGRLKLQVPGPWTLATALERPRGDRVIGDHGARRDLAQSLAAGVAAHLAEVSRRVDGAEVLVQVDEPAMPAVLAGKVPTASGLGRHRSIETAEAEDMLRWVTDGVRGADAHATPVAHSCSARLPVTVFARSGFGALAFDPATVSSAEYETYAAAFEDGLDLWPGVVPSVEPSTYPSDGDLVAALRQFFETLGYDPEQVASRVVVTPACGLAGASSSWARRALALARTTARALT